MSCQRGAVGMATIKEDTITQEITPAAAFRNKYLLKEEESNSSILFEPKSNVDEPKIVLSQQEGSTTTSSTLLSKLSKTTAPMRAKLSRSKSKIYERGTMYIRGLILYFY